MIIDSHQHVFWHGRDDRGLVEDMAEHGIDVAWLLTWEIPCADFDSKYSGVLNPSHIRPDGSHPGIPLQDLLVARDRHPGKFVLGYCPDPAKPNAPAMLEAATRMHDVRVCGEWKFRMLIDDPRCIELFRAAGSLGLPVVLHLDIPWLNGVFQHEWYGGTIENLERALLACPNTQFIGHAPGFWREITGAAGDTQYPDGKVTSPGRLYEMFDKHPNLYADLSARSGLTALTRDPAHARNFVLRFSDRLLFGRDYYGGELRDFLETLDLPTSEKKKVYEGNALSLVPFR
jgi:predicted TIM-barrel fold metal-dependent hydrolase